MTPFAQHIQHYAATLITHPMWITEPVGKAGPGADILRARRRQQITQLLKEKPSSTQAIAFHVGVGPKLIIGQLYAMQDEGLLSMTKTAAGHCSWSLTC